jgi:hypothetical protein
LRQHQQSFHLQLLVLVHLAVGLANQGYIAALVLAVPSISIRYHPTTTVGCVYLETCKQRNHRYTAKRAQRF